MWKPKILKRVFIPNILWINEQKPLLNRHEKIRKISLSIFTQKNVIFASPTSKKIRQALVQIISQIFLLEMNFKKIYTSIKTFYL